MASDTPAKSDRKALIGRYQISNRVGAGGMGAVYRATHLDLGREVALKVLPADMAASPEMLERFRLEARNAAKLRHDHIVTLYEFGESNGTHFLAMEFIEGINLHQYIDQKGRLEAEEARKLLIQGTRALVHAHKQGIVHRDIKPSNFLLTQKDGRPFVKLTDFGLARRMDDNEFKVTRTGTTVGTVDYIAPEQARNSRSADVRSDIYSLGCTLYHMLAGKPPFAEGDMTERLLKHVEAEAEDVRHFNPKIPEGLVIVLKKMIAKKPEDRYQTPSELLKDLEHPPSGPSLSPREALEMLAEASGERAKPFKRPAAETKKLSAVERTRPLGLPSIAAEAIKPRYRDNKVRRNRKRNPEDGSTQGSLLVIQGWKAWAAVGGVIVVVGLVGLALALGWGSQQDNSVRRTDRTGFADSGTKESKQSDNGESTKETPKPSQPSSKKEARRRPSGTPGDQDPHATSTGTERLPRIHEPDQTVLQEMNRHFQPPRQPGGTESSGSSTQIVSRGGQNPTQGGQPLPPSPPDGSSSPATTITPPSTRNSGGGTGANVEETPPRTGQSPVSPPTNPPSETGSSVGSGKLGSTKAPSANGPKSPSPSATPVYVVSRLSSTKDQFHFESLAAALARAGSSPKGQKIIIEVRDNGPLFEVPAAIGDHNVTIRAAEGFRPLIAWEVNPALSRAKDFLSVSRGDLTLENLDVAVKCADSAPPAQASMVHVDSGNLEVLGCTFSAGGRHQTGISILHIEGARPEGSLSCRLDRCYFRGAEIIPVDVRTPAEVVIDHCLMVGGYLPLIDVHGKTAGAISIRVARSTLTAGQTVLRIHGTVGDKQPQVQWLGWDTLLAHHGSQATGEMIDLQDGATPDGMKWRSVNCLYSGWPVLLKCDGGNVSDLAVWRKLWNMSEGDELAASSWPAVVPADPSESPAAAFRVVGTHAGFAASSGKGALGCDVSMFPMLRDGWLGFTYDRTQPPAWDRASVDTAPEIPMGGDTYQGERLDLTQVNLGDRLQNLQEKGRLGARVVMHLTGKGEVRCSPIAIKDVSLVLYFEPSTGERDRLTLVPTAGAPRPAFIDVQGGSCEIIGGAIRLRGERNSAAPEHLIRVKGGDLRITGCRLERPLASGSKSPAGLIHFSGSGEGSSTRVFECALADTVLFCGNAAVQSVGVGARTRLHNCLVVTAGTAIELDPGAALDGRLNLQCVLEQNTFAARQSVLAVVDVANLPPGPEPIVVLARDNLVLSPSFAESPGRAGVFVCGQEALTHGMVVWQGDGNGYDKRLHFYACEGGIPEAPQPHDVCRRVWGSAGDRRALMLDLPPGARMDGDDPHLEQLTLPEPVRAKLKGARLGADLDQLGLLKKKS